MNADALTERILSYGRGFRALDFDVDDALMKLARDALRAHGTDTGITGALARQIRAGRPLSTRQAAQALNAFRRIAATPCPDTEERTPKCDSPVYQRCKVARKAGKRCPDTAPAKPAAACVHHWRIAEASGGRRRLPAVCKICGATRTFSVSLPDGQHRTKGKRHD